MARCNDLADYEDLWHEFNKTIFTAPLLYEKHENSVKVEKIEWKIRTKLLTEMRERDKLLKEQALVIEHDSSDTETIYVSKDVLK